MVIVGGRAQSGQFRASVSEKGDIANFLEGDNMPGSGAGLIPNGDELFVTTSSNSNDVVCSDLSCS